MSVSAVVGAALLVLAGPIAAQAADGDLRWVDKETGQEHVIWSPADGSCVPFKDDQGKQTVADHVFNGTDRPVEVFAEADCGGAGVWTLGPDEEYPNDDAKSVRIWANDEHPRTP